jgi:hypothetical protein
MIGYLRLPLSWIAHSDRVGLPLMRITIADAADDRGAWIRPAKHFTDTLVSADAIKVRVFAADSRRILSTEAVVFQVPILVSC